MKSCFIGADVGGTAIKLGGFTENGELIEKWSIPTRLDDRGRFILPEVSLSVREWAARRKWSIAGIGLGVPGPVTKEGKVLKCANLGWDVFSCKDKMVELTGIDNIEVANDANAAGLGESWMGAGRCYQSIVMVTLGTGIGGSIIINKKILHGFNGAAGEIGHMKVEDDEKDICGCGCSGCLEQYASAKGIVRLAKKYMKEGSHIYKYKDRLSAKIVFDGAKDGDENCLEVLDRFGEYLGTALSNVSCVVDTEAIVIGGGVSKAGDILIDKVSEWYRKKSLYAIQNKIFRTAELGNDAGIYGCAKLVIAGVRNNPHGQKELS